ncbi:alpha/beta hydrolase family protein [Muriicola sp. E247]|uniref:alpha/beta hydrolase family protein n=1 Tax=Muriicola sp. E247 TaxID=3242730 RepID=UPI00352636EB
MKIVFFRKFPFLLLFLLAISTNTSCQEKREKQKLSEDTPYKVKKDSVWIDTSNGTIFGFLFQPIRDDNEKVPAVLCLQGGGDVGLANYLYEAEFFAKNGIVALVCDKSGTGLSETEKRWQEQSFKDKTTEYLELHKWLSSQKAIDSLNVGVHGMSEGGRLALNMAIRSREKIAFVNVVSGPIASFKENQLYAIQHYLAAQGFKPTEIEQAVDVWEIYFNDVGKGLISDETISSIKKLIESLPKLRYRPAVSKNLPSRPLREDIHFGLEGSVGSITCPVLFQYGENDILVDPVTSISLIPDKPNFLIKLYPDTDHSMNLENGNIHPNFLNDKKYWIENLIWE